MKTMLSTIVCGLVLGASTIAVADTSQADLEAKLQAMQQRLDSQQQEIQQLRSANGDSWLNERRTEEVKSLIRDVLSDSSTRASLAEGGMTAGWRDHFFLASEDGNFLLRLSGQSQTRYIYQNVQGVERTTGADTGEEGEDDDQVSGFQQRRTKVRFDGHLFDPKFTYAIQMNASLAGNENSEENIGTSHDENAGVFRLEDAWSEYEFADGWKVKVGQFKAPFLRDELVNSKHQLAVERSYVTDVLTVDYTQGIQLSYGGELAGVPIRAAAMIHDGTYMANTDFDNDVSDFAIAARVEVLVAGDWAQFDDYAAWSTDSFGLMVGAAVDWESSEEGAGNAFYYELFKWTVDVSVEVPDLNGLNGFFAVVGQSIDAEFTGASPDDADQIAFIAQGGIFIIPDKWDIFVRYEYLDQDGLFLLNHDNFGAHQETDTFSDDDEDEINIVTLGTNYYFHKHAAKATLDVMWILDPIDTSDTGAGISEHLEKDDGDEEFVIRAQFQFLF